MTDLCQDINRVFLLEGALMEQFLEGIAPLTQMSEKQIQICSEIIYQSLKGVLPLRKCSIKEPA